MTPPHIMLIDADRAEHQLLDGVQQQRSCFSAVSHAVHLEQAFDRLLDTNFDNLPDIIVIDPHMQQNKGWLMLRQIKAYYNRLHKQVSICVLANSYEPQEVKRAYKNQSVFTLLYKPLCLDDLQLSAGHIC